MQLNIKLFSEKNARGVIRAGVLNRITTVTKHVLFSMAISSNLIALRTAKIVYNFGLPESNRVKVSYERPDKLGF